MIPAAWAGAFIRHLSDIECGANADPDFSVGFAIINSVVVGTPLGMLGALVVMLLMMLA